MTSIRPAGKEDAPALAYLFDQYRQFYGQQSDPEGAADFLKARLEAGESVVYLALEEGELCGFCQLYPIFSSVSMRRAWLLNDLYVHESFRKKGIASKLLDAVVTMAAEQKAPWLLLQTGAANTVAQALYEQKGWVRESDLFYRYDID